MKPVCCGEVVKNTAMGKEFWFCKGCRKEVKEYNKANTVAPTSNSTDITKLILTPPSSPCVHLFATYVNNPSYQFCYLCLAPKDPLIKFI